jgi:hypothetical protein
MIQNEGDSSAAAKTHPHAEANYRIIPFSDGSFGIEVKIPGSYPTTISKFATQDDAESWIVEHQRLVQSEIQAGRWFRRPSGYQR